MKKITFLLSVLFLLVVFAFNTKYPILNTLGVSTAFAVGDLTIDWGVPAGNPIFSFNNFAPGQTETHSVNVTNSATTTKPVAVRGLKTSESGGLGDVLKITIQKGATTLYGPKTLNQFFTDSAAGTGVFLSNYAPAESSLLTFTVSFDSSAGNTFQNKTLVFDLQIGISADIPVECSGMSFSKIIFGTQRRDSLHGTTGSDLIFGFEGNDTLNGVSGNDCLVGGLGNDQLNGSNGDDILIGEDGNDRLDGSNGNDKMYGNAGRDNLNGSNGEDQLFGGSEDDTLSGSNGNDLLSGELGDDSMDGGNGNDNLNGGLGNDKASGKSGIDTCVAENKSSCEL